MLAATVSAAGFFTRIPFAPLPLAVVVAMLVWYLRSVRRLGEAGGGWPAARGVSWVAGVGVIAFALCSGMVSWDATSMGVHGAIDMLVALVAPVFLALGAPLTLAAGSAGGHPARLEQALGGRVGRLVTFPVFTWVVFGGSLFAMYFAPYYRAARAHATLLQLGHLELLAAGFLFVLPALGADAPARRLHPGLRITYLMLGLIVFTLFGMGLDSRTRSGIPGVPIAGVHVAGDLIWSAGVVIAIAASVGILYVWLFSDLRQAREADAADAEELALQASLWRVSRLLAKPEEVKEAERQLVLKRQTVAASARRRAPDPPP